MKTKQLENFCEALASLYESELCTAPEDTETDWWHAFNEDIDVNLWSDGERLLVSAYQYTEDGLDTTTHTNIIDKQIKPRRTND